MTNNKLILDSDEIILDTFDAIDRDKDGNFVLCLNKTGFVLSPDDAAALYWKLEALID